MGVCGNLSAARDEGCCVSLKIMNVYLAADHAGFALKEKIKLWLTETGYTVKDFGASMYNPDDDYPDFMHQAAAAVAKDPEGSRALLFGGGGQGEAMVANHYKGVRAAVFYGPRVPVEAADVAGRISVDLFEQVRLAREHNNANVLSFGARFVNVPDAQEAVKLFLVTPFSNDARHQRRIAKID